MTHHLFQSMPFYLIFAFVIFSVTACKDTSPAEGPYNGEVLEPDGADAEGRPIYTCTGDLCYDPDDPDAQERRDELIAIAELAFSESDTFEQDLQEFRDEMMLWGEGYAACNYQKDESTHLISVDCPDWVEDIACPGEFYQSTDTSGMFRPNNAPSHRTYCVPEALETSQRACDYNLACPNGEVCTGMLSATRADTGEMHSGLWCIPAASCDVLQQRYNIDDAQSCFYSDFTTIENETPPKAPISCDSLALGTCTRGCACSAEDDPLAEYLGTNAHCENLSEQNAVGLCSTVTCEEDDDCVIHGDGVCAQHSSLPAWAAAHYQGILDAITNHFDLRPKPGFCVSKSACEVWNDAYGSQLICGTASGTP